MSFVTHGPKEDPLTPCPHIARQQLRAVLWRSHADAAKKLGHIPLHERSEYLGQDPFRLSPFLSDKGSHRHQRVWKVIPGPPLSLKLLAQDGRVGRKLLRGGVVGRGQPAVGQAGDAPQSIA
jgi:hypothetical protein